MLRLTRTVRERRIIAVVVRVVLALIPPRSPASGNRGHYDSRRPSWLALDIGRVHQHVLDASHRERLIQCHRRSCQRSGSASPTTTPPSSNAWLLRPQPFPGIEGDQGERALVSPRSRSATWPSARRATKLSDKLMAMRDSFSLTRSGPDSSLGRPPSGRRLSVYSVQRRSPGPNPR